MATRKPFMGRVFGLGTAAGTQYFNIAAIQLSATDFRMPWFVAGSLKNLRVTLTAAPGAAVSRTIAIYINGSASGISVVLTGTGSGNGITFGQSLSSASVADGDTVQLRVTNSGTVATCDMKFSVEQDASTAGQSMHGGLGFTTLGNATYYGNPWSYVNPTTTDPGSQTSLVDPPLARGGTIDKWGFKLTTAPASGKSRSFVLMKNNTAQDGTGGTPDTTFSIANTATENTKSGFTLTWSAGDRIWWKQTVSGGPTDSGINACSMRVTLTDGYSIMANDNPTFATCNDDDYMPTPGNVAWTSTEANATMEGPITTVSLANLYVRYDTSCQRSLTLRKNGSGSTLVATTTGSPSQQISDTTHTVTLASGDAWTWRDDDLAGGFRALIWSVEMFIDPGGLSKPWVYRPHTKTIDASGINKGVAQ